MATDYIAPSGADSRPAQASAEACCPSINSGVFSLSAALVVNDTIVMCKLPARHVPVDLILSASDLDTNVSPAIVLNVELEDGETDVALLSGSTIGQGGGLARLALHAPRIIAPSDEDRDVRVKVATGPGTGAATGTLALTLFSRPAGRDDARGG
jgi:hypothetical protein